MKTLKRVLLTIMITFSLNSFAGGEAIFELIGFNTNDTTIRGEFEIIWDDETIEDFKYLKISDNHKGVTKRLSFGGSEKITNKNATLVYKCKEISSRNVKGKYLIDELSVKNTDKFLIIVKMDYDYIATVRIIHKESKDFLEFTYKL